MHASNGRCQSLLSQRLLPQQTVAKTEMSLAMANTIQIVRSPDRENIRLVLQAYGKDDRDHKRYAAVLEDLLANGEKA